MGNGPRWGRYNLYFEELKSLSLKNAPYFSDLCWKNHATILEHNKSDPLGGLNLKV